MYVRVARKPSLKASIGTPCRFRISGTYLQAHLFMIQYPIQPLQLPFTFPIQQEGNLLFHSTKTSNEQSRATFRPYFKCLSRALGMVVMLYRAMKRVTFKYGTN